MRPNSITVTDAQKQESISIVGDTYKIIVSGQQTGGAYSIIDMLIPPQGGPGPHAHAEINESFYVLDGEIVFKSETQVYTAKKGAYVNIPRGGAVHCFKNETTSVAHIVCLVIPSGLDAFFNEVGKPVETGSFLPQTPMSPEEIKHLQDTAIKYGQELFPPNYLDK